MYFDELLDEDLKALALQTDESEASHVRRAVRTYLDAQVVGMDGHDDDPLLELVGLAGESSAPRDLARHHDRYLYGKAVNGGRDDG